MFFFAEENKLNMEGVAECRFFLQGVKDLRYADSSTSRAPGHRPRAGGKGRLYNLHPKSMTPGLFVSIFWLIEN